MKDKISGHENLAFELGSKDKVEKNPAQTNVVVSTHHEQTDRVKWGNSIEFLMSCIAMSVGLGNVWRFPFTAQQNGGGAFLIPYIIVLTLIGKPLYYMEMGLGQFCSKSNVKTFESISPILKGIGYGQTLGSILVATYYCSLVAITFFYLFNSFTSQFPWSECQSSWKLTDENITCIPAHESGTSNFSLGIERKSSSELYFRREVLQEYQNIDNGIGLPEWRLTLCLLLSWVILFVVSCKGVKSSGKASYFLAIFPYVIMIAILIRALTLEGSLNGILYFISTDWNKLLDPNVWYAAVTQCFFSLNVGFSAIIMYSSYNKFDQNINRDVWIVTTLDTFTSLLSGCTVFAILGNLAHQLGVEPEEVVNGGGTGLAFISYPDAIAKFKAVPWLFAILFFFMLLVLGLGSLTALQNTITTVIKDQFPNVAIWKISLFTSLGGFLLGLIYVTPGGQFMLNLVDHFGGTFIIYFLAILETTGVAWLYGIDNFCLDMEFMLKRRIGPYWRLTWGVITPVLLILIFVYFVVSQTRLTYGEAQYPDLVLAFGWCIVALAVLLVITWCCYYIYKNRKYGFPEMIKKAATHERWRPADNTNYEEWKKFKENAFSKEKRTMFGWMRSKIYILHGRSDNNIYRVNDISVNK